MKSNLLIDSIDLPSGWQLQWRSDERWRQVHINQLDAEKSGLLGPEEADWTSWSGSDQLTGRGGGHWDGAATWWLLVGEMPAEGRTEVVLADGLCPPVLQVGRVWACTWVSPVQSAIVRRGGNEVGFKFYKPSYR